MRTSIATFAALATFPFLVACPITDEPEPADATSTTGDGDGDTTGDGDGDTSGDGDGDTSEDPAGPIRTVFLTGVPYELNFGSLEGADTACQESAMMGGLTGTYMAWISDSQTSAAERLPHSDGPYVLPNGTQIAANWDDLTDGSLDAPINVWETGTQTDTPIGVATATFSDGGASMPNCLDWTSNSPDEQAAYGSNQADGVLWSDSGNLTPCSSPRSLYCFQVSEEEPPPPPEGNTVFLTGVPYALNFGSLEGADAACQESAAMGGLTGTYMAWISDSQTSAGERLPHSDAPYVLPNGTQIAANWDDLIDGSLDAPINVWETGTQTDTPIGVATATFSDGGASMPNCLDWTSDSPDEQAAYGSNQASGVLWSDSGNLTPCSSPRSLYCFQVSKEDPPPPPPMPDMPPLAGYWPFNGDTSEASGTNIDLNPVGSPAYEASVSPGLGTAMTMDGDDGAIGPDFVKFTGDDASIVAWAYADGLAGGWNTIVKNWGWMGGQFHLGLGAANDDFLQNNLAFNASTITADPFPTGEWIHVAVIVDSAAGEHRLYMNGVEVANVAYMAPLGDGGATGLGIGIKPNNDGTATDVGWWIGSIDEVGLYNAALTPEQVNLVYQDGLGGVQLDGTSE